MEGRGETRVGAEQLSLKMLGYLSVILVRIRGFDSCKEVCRRGAGVRASGYALRLLDTLPDDKRQQI